jgi:hypothetical protein
MDGELHFNRSIASEIDATIGSMRGRQSNALLNDLADRFVDPGRRLALEQFSVAPDLSFEVQRGDLAVTTNGIQLSQWQRAVGTDAPLAVRELDAASSVTATYQWRTGASAEFSYDETLPRSVRINVVTLIELQKQDSSGDFLPIQDISYRAATDAMSKRYYPELVARYQLFLRKCCGLESGIEYVAR